ncbi:MAG: hypothetical protein KKH92_02135 [Firmicutes bacterium]|nr:hypothetical protein [Bacillota bacterium]
MKRIFAIWMLSLLILSGCVYVADSKKIYDDNEKIVTEGDTYTFIDRIGDVLEDEASLEVKGFYGTETIYTFENIEEITITITQDVNKGRFKVVLINPQNEITVLNGTSTITMSDGKYRIKIVGENAFATIDITIEDKS